MAVLQSFNPIGNTATVNASSGASTPGAIGTVGNQLRVYNSGTVIAFIAWAVSGAVATTGGVPIPPGATEIFTIDPSAASVAAITAASTATVYFTRGEGI